jgi:Baseplate J-like protein
MVTLSTATHYRCTNERRLALVRDTLENGTPVINGIDYLEVTSNAKVLELHFIHDLHVSTLTKNNIGIRGGVRTKGTKVISVAATGKILTVTCDEVGDFSTYTLFLRASTLNEQPPSDFDSQLSEVDFSFRIDCPSDFDCKTETVCPPEPLDEPGIDYLAKDYDSFRRLLLDRMSVTMPDWKERNPADMGVALVELLAYVGDHLSYYQDAVATEAYLGTARHRISVKRHARLLDYLMSEGCNARVWVALEVEADNIPIYKPKPDEFKPGTLLLTRSSLPEGVLVEEDAVKALREGALAFETLHELTPYKAHNKINFYTWGNWECCLPKGATRATLDNTDNCLEKLKKDDVPIFLIFEEVLSPTTGSENDADPQQRHAVRLTKVEPVEDLLVFEKGSTTQKQRLLEIEWHTNDALPFPLCLSAKTTKGDYLEHVSIAQGNVVLADYGLTVSEALPVLEEDTAHYRPELRVARGSRQSTASTGLLKTLEQFFEVTQQLPVTQRVPLNNFSLDTDLSATAVMDWELREVQPTVRLLETTGQIWQAQRDLLSSQRFAREFVVEVDNDGRTSLRFGDDVLGAKPEEGFSATAIYRVGNGRAGNVGREAIVNIVGVAGVTKVRNPLLAKGGLEPEKLEQVKLYAPQAFRKQERAVTAADYAEVTERHPEVQKAAATIRWTGSWYTVFITIDCKGGRAVDAEFEGDIRGFIERYRLAGHDLEVNAPQFVPLELAMDVCVKPGYYRSEVKKALLEVFSNRDSVRLGRGFFHPDNFTFGQSVYVSQLYAAAMQVTGVQSVDITTFKRFGKATNNELDYAVLTTGRLEIVRLDNDPNFPENGLLELVMKGGL